MRAFLCWLGFHPKELDDNCVFRMCLACGEQVPGRKLVRKC